jgi:tetratricopeptide (TPR) repeat protein
VFWVHADNETTFTQDYKAIAKRLGLAGSLDGPELLMAVRERIEVNPCWVLILDNADNLAVFGVGRTQPGAEEKHGLCDFVPRGPAGTVLWTSRDKRIGGSLVGARRAIHVGGMTEGEARTLLEAVRDEEIGEAEAQGAVREENQMACNILHALAYLDNQNIPFALIAKVAETMGRPAGDREATSASNDDVRAAAVLLQDFSFLRLRTSDDRRGAYDMHKLVQEATQCSLRQETRGTDERRFSEVALRAVADLFPERRRELWEECERYLVHTQRAAEWAELCGGEVDAAALLSRASNYLFDRGRWREKEPVDKKAYAFRKQVLGEKHPDTIRSMASLAATYHAQGRDDEAEKIMVEVLGLRREVLGEKHPDTIWSMAGLAATYHEQGRYDEAEKIKVEVLGLRREVLGEKHPDTIESMAELAATYHAQGRYDEAEKIFVEVLALRRDVLGEKHPDTLQAMHDLAVTWDSRQRRPEALAMMQDCFQLQRNVLGELHPSTRRSLHALHLFGRIAQHLKSRISE